MALRRREVLKMGLMSGAAYMGLGRRRALAGGSPAMTPFVDPLPIPPVARPVESLDPAPDGALHQRYDEFKPKHLYAVHQREALHRFHKELPPSRVWGYEGIVPGPTFHARYGSPILARFYNDLPKDHVGFGIPETTIHLHNAHTASESDGFTGDFFKPGTHRDNHYANMLAGGDPREALSTLWYHDHRIDFTAQNMYKGLSGFYLLFDDQDSGDEADKSSKALRLPSGEFDVPLLLADKTFDSEGKLFFDPLETFEGFLGDRMTVNGKVQPYFKVARRKYRFRLVNTGPSRFYELFLSNDAPFTLIANDGNLLPKPLTVASARLAVAERMDIVIDFSKFTSGTEIVLENRLEQLTGRGPTDQILDHKNATPILKFIVNRDAQDRSVIPDVMRELPPVDLKEVVETRQWVFNFGGAWTVNGNPFDVNRVDATPKQGTAEKWIFVNRRAWSHPIHIHLEELRILTRNGESPKAPENSRKDIVELHPNEIVEVFIRFRDWHGKYMMHCHNAVHEDHAMMVRFDVVK